jgi:hypothetical protein
VTAGKRIEVKTVAPTGADDYDLVIHKTSNSGPIVDSSGAGAGVTQNEVEVAHISPATDGVGVFTVHVIYFATVPGDQYHGTATVVPLTPSPPPPAPADTGPKVGYENFEAPGVLTPVTVSTGPTVEYMGRGAGEPSIGVNWNSLAPNNVTGVTNFQSDLETLFITFANACSTGGPTATWANRPAPTSKVIDSDPIGFTDRQTGRVFAAELSATSPTCKISYSDDDGNTWVASPGTLGSGIDHETMGGGPYHAPLVGTPAYANAVYYCSQDLVAAFCLRSDDGGATWGPPVDTYTTECGGLHGHVKVSPKDGTVYLPNNNCGGDGAVVVSEDNGITWHVRHVGNATVQTASGGSDPAVGIDNNGRVYFVMANADSAAVVATSDDHGNTWQNIFDVSAAYGLKNIRYPAAVAANGTATTPGRAAVAFLGTTTTGSSDSGTFSGLWHLYVGHTFDGGLTWTTSDVTPGAPMQRGCIWNGGGANICRNLLDFFDVTIDKQGRVEVGYVNGCPGGNCAQAAPTATGNAYGATATIARQSSGRRLLAAFDPPTATSVPGMPSITQRRVGPVVHLGWSEADTGNSTITKYKIMRGTASGGETLLTTVGGTQTTYDDLTANDITKTYYYKVVAINGVGMSCANNEIAAPYVGDTCTGLIIHQNLSTHPESAAVQNPPGANAQLAIDYVAVGEPPATTNLMFKMKVSNLSSVPANSRWRMVWDSFSSPGQQYYVGMRSDVNSAVTFDYGTIATAVVGLVVGVPTETFVAAALPASNFNADGTITIFVPKSAVGNPQPGDLLGAVNGRTFTGDTAETMTLERSTALIDHTFVKAQTDNAFPAATYTVVGNVACGGPSPLPCSGTPVEDDDPHITYSNGWHLINDSSASAGHFRLNEGGNNIHSAVLTFDDTALTGSVTYFYATSTKGGSADIYLDNVKVDTVSYNGSSGSNRSPVFAVAPKTYSYSSTMGVHHTLEIRPIHDGVFIDGFCLPHSATPTGTPAAYPGATSQSLATQSAGQTLLSSITLPTGTQAISIAAEPSVAVPIQLVLINPSGAVVQTVNSSSGVAILEAPITQSGVYTIKTVNLSAGPMQIWSVATPLVSQM